MNKRKLRNSNNLNLTEGGHYKILYKKSGCFEKIEESKVRFIDFKSEPKNSSIYAELKKTIFSIARKALNKGKKLEDKIKILENENKKLKKSNEKLLKKLKTQVKYEDQKLQIEKNEKTSELLTKNNLQKTFSLC